MKEVKRTSKLIIVADKSGKILSAMWPGPTSEGAPTEVGLRLSEGQESHEVEVPDQLSLAARPDLSHYHLEIKGGKASLVSSKK